ncbi:MAG: hypothetical protein ABGZ17_24170 [Planctomycetaceae bacterium]
MVRCEQARGPLERQRPLVLWQRSFEIPFGNALLEAVTLQVEMSETRTARPMTSILQCLMVLADVRGVSCIECSGQRISV